MNRHIDRSVSCLCQRKPPFTIIYYIQKVEGLLPLQLTRKLTGKRENATENWDKDL